MRPEMTLTEPTSKAYEFENNRYHIPCPGPTMDEVMQRVGDILNLKDEPDYSTPFAEKVLAVTDAIAELLVKKNKSYGDSALNPVRIFSTASTEEQLLVRLDDKLSRIARGNDFGEDVLDDILGYVVLLKIVRMEENNG